jgi:hypothetical protein
MVSGGTFPGGDPFLQKQNEPSIAVSTRNPCHLLAGANDYRAVNLPGLPEDREIGDAWLGWYESTDCGSTWYSTLVPGYLQDSSPEGLASPVKGLTAGADPVVRAGSGGSFYYLFIAFNRGSNVGKLALARGIDHNDREEFIDPDKTPDIGARRLRSPIQYAGTIEVARGSSGRFIDKPSLAVFPGTGTCTLHGETIPATNVYVAWTEFLGNSDQTVRTKVHFVRSSDCGATWSPATKLSEGYPVNQGTVIAVNPRNPQDIYVLWRQIRSDKTRDAILYARSTDGGGSFTKAVPIPGLGEGEYFPFDQNTTSTLLGDNTITFRTVGYPTVAFTDELPNGQLYVALTQPLMPNASGGLGGLNSRIKMMRTDGTAWTSLVDVVPSSATGHQIMPALSYAAGKLQLIWYDLRFDESGLTDTLLVDETQALGTQPRIRHTMDVLGAQASVPIAAWPPPAGFFQPYGVAQPDYNDIDPITGQHILRGPRLSTYVIGDPNTLVDEGAGPKQLQFNFPNLFLYGGGRMSFMGDYIDIAGTAFVPDGLGNWSINGLANSTNAALGAFHAAWTDNRDAGIPASSTVSPLSYTPPASLPPNMTLKNAPPCTADDTRTRDANVYTSRVTQDFSLTVPGNNKRTNVDGVVRAFAVQLANGLDTPASFTLSVADVNGSFSRETFLGSACAAQSVPVSIIPVNVLPKSSVTRTVYINCGAAAARRVVVTATRSDLISASVVINADPTSPPSKDANGDPLGPEAHNPDAENPDAENPDAENPDAENPDAENPDAENPDAENPDAENPDAENPDAENPDAENPDAENPDAENANFQDVSIDVTNSGDTTSGYQVLVQAAGDTSGYSFLLLGNRVYGTPTSINCYLVRRRTNQQIFAIHNPDLTATDFPAENDPDPKHATILVRPGESIRVVLRAVWDSVVTPEPFCSTDPSSPNYCFKKLTFRTRAQAPNTGETVPREDSIGGPADLILTGVLSASPMVAGLGGFVDSPGATIENAGFSEATDFSWGTFLAGDEGGGAETGTVGGTGGLAPGDTIPTGPARIRIPFSTGEEQPFQPGDYFVGFEVDSSDTVQESNERNNTLTTAAPIEVVNYQASIGAPETVTAGIPFDVRVSVFGPTGASLSNAVVTLSLEGPGTSPNVPGPPGSMSPPNPTETTNSDGALFEDLSISNTGDRYRLVATIDVRDEVGNIIVGGLKFQSSTFTVFPFVGN